MNEAGRVFHRLSDAKRTLVVWETRPTIVDRNAQGDGDEVILPAAVIFAGQVIFAVSASDIAQSAVLKERRSDMAQAYREQMTVTGDFARVNIYPVRSYQYGRKKKMKPTGAAMERVNRGTR